MKKNRIFGLASAIALLAAGACSNDMIDPNKNSGGLLNTGDGSGGVYMTVDFKMPSGGNGTRSETWDPDDENENPNGFISSDGEEVGLEAENNVTSALIVLAFDKTDGILNAEEGVTPEKYGYIVAGEVFNNHISHVSTSDNSNMLEATAKLNKNNLNRLYGLFYDESTKQYNVPSVYVFVFCNPTQDLRAIFAAADGEDKSTLQFGSADWINATCKVIQNGSSDQNIGIWSPNAFLMNNKTLTTRDLPKKLLDWENFSDYNKAFHLSEKNSKPGVYEDVDNSSDVEGRGAVLVERSVARFDFKDGSKLGSRSYNVLFAMDDLGDLLDGTNGTACSPLAAVQLQKMCLVNMGNQFYYLPRVSDNGQLNGLNYELCGKEKPWKRDQATGEYTNGNYVVGPYADVFKNAASDFGYDDVETEPKPEDPENPFGDNILLGGKPIGSYFNYPFFDDNGLYNQDMNIGSRWGVVNIADILSNGNSDNYADKKYNIWRYVVENVIPASTDNQVNGISTGVVFKAQIIAPVIGTNDENPAKYDEYWCKGYAENLMNLLSGKPFTYNSETHDKLAGNSKLDPILYYKDGRLYMGWRNMRQAAIQESVTMDVSGKLEINDGTALYQAVFGNGPIPAGQKYYYLDADKKLQSKDIEDPRWLVSYKTDGSTNTNDADYLNYKKSPNYLWTVWSNDGKNESIDEEGHVNAALANMRDAITSAGTTIYQSSTDVDTKVPGYYCYYYYWNRHNDNHMNGSMGPMEFDVVRNNVYKLSVDEIKRLGHPRIPGNDPNSPDPGTKDESEDIYLDVKVKILPWVVRLNSITF